MNFLRLAVLVPLLAAPTLAFAQNTLINPNPIDCCQCIKITVNGVSNTNSPGKEPLRIEGENGEFKFKLNVKVTKGTTTPTGFDCQDVKITSITLVPKDNTGPQAAITPSVAFPQQGAGVDEYTGDVTISGFVYSGVWTIKVSCEPEAKADDSATRSTQLLCEFPITLASGCPSCDSGTCEPQASNGCFTYKIPLGTANAGDTTGTLSFFTKDFTNPGPAGLAAIVPASYTVIPAAGTITSIITPTSTITVSPPANPPNDNTFTITQKDTATDKNFRTTVISFTNNTLWANSSLLAANGTTVLSTTRHEQTEASSGGTTTYTLDSGSFPGGGTYAPLRREILEITPDIPAAAEVHTKSVLQADTVTGILSLISKIETTWTNYPWGWEKTKEVIDPGTATANQNLTSTWSYYSGEPGTTSEAYGRLKYHQRYDGHEETHSYMLDGGQSIHITILPFAGNSQGLTLTRTWNPVNNTLTTTRKVGSATLSEETKTYDSDEKSITSVTKASSETSLTTTTTLMPFGLPFGGQPKSISHPDGTITTYTYQRYEDGGKSIVMTSGEASNTTPDTVTLGKSTTSTINRFGTTVRSLTATVGYTPTNITLDHFAVTGVDTFGRATATAYFPASSSVDVEFKVSEKAFAIDAEWTTAATYSCCGIESSTDRHAIETVYEYDGLHRQTKSTTLGVITDTIYSGLTTSTKRNNAEIAKSVRNLVGDVIESWTPDPSSTTAGALAKTAFSTTYKPDGVHAAISATTVPGDGLESTRTQSTSTFLDGSIARSTGALEPNMAYYYSVNGGLVTTSAYVGGNETERTITTADWAGRTTNITKGTESTDYAYYDLSNDPAGSRGKLKSISDADTVRTLYDYNTLGELTTTARKLDAADTITYSTDQITKTTTAPGTYGGYSVLTTITSVYAVNNSTASTPASTTHQAPNGLHSWTIAAGSTAASGRSATIGSNQAWTETTTNPDNSYSVSYYVGGRLDHITAYASNNAAITTTTYGGFDASNRPTEATDTRTGTTTTTYVSTTCDAVASVRDPGNRTTSFTYDSRGRLTDTYFPDHTQQHPSVTHTSYYSTGLVKAQWGSQTYPTFKTYDYAGRIKVLRTKPSLDINGVPTSGGNSTTTWYYSSTTGRLESKLDATNVNGTTYTYTSAGRLRTVKSARGHWTRHDYLSGLPVGTRHFAPGAAFAAVIAGSADADPLTPDTVIVPDRLGRPESITQNKQSQIVYTYAADFGIDTEIISYDLNHNGDFTESTDFTRTLDRRDRELGRDKGWELKKITTVNGVTTTVIENEATYTYGSTTGSLATVAGASSGTFTYGYSYTQANANAPRAGSSTGTKQDFIPYTVAGPVHNVTNTYEATRTALLTKSNIKVSGNDEVSTIGYTVNSIGQRTNAARSGAVVNSTTWGYDDLGQLTKADEVTPANDRAYAYDSIGNRKEARNGVIATTGTDNYLSNTRNQYTRANGVNMPAGSYDTDGNMTSGPIPVSPTAVRTLVWDAGNRLIEVKNGSTNIVTYAYDALNRRIARIPATGAVTLYLYDGWNVIAEYNGTTHALVRTNLWGLDLSGSLHGAGGVGGLLAVKLSDVSYYPCYDGNGNITEYLNASGTVAAHFEYDPFGNTVADTDTNRLFNYRFSTKPLDFETGLYYYGYRFYDPLTGRWPSRDTIEEEGGVNLYGFVQNDGVNLWDVLGLELPDNLKCCKIKKIIVNFNQVKEAPNHKVSEDGMYNHKTGRLFLGTITVSCADGNSKDWDTQTGGMRMKTSAVRGPGDRNLLGDDSAAPAGDFTISTSPSGKTKGYLINTSKANRDLIKIHYASYEGSHGCATSRYPEEWKIFVDLMALNKSTYSQNSVPVRIQYVGIAPPVGNRGNGKCDPPIVPVALPVCF